MKTLHTFSFPDGNFECKQQTLSANHMQVCVNTLPRKEDTSSDLRGAIIAVRQFRKGYKVISKQCGVHKSTVRKVIHMWETFKADATLLRGES